VVQTSAGRQRYSVLGALDADTRTLLRETTDGSVNEFTFSQLLIQIRDVHPKGPISVVCDNAKYQHTQLVKTVAAWKKIDLVYLPTYSPNLNLIERVWKFVKKEALSNRTFEDFAAFKSSIDEVLDGLPTKYQGRMKTLLTHNFETIEKPSASSA
jgi:transposase